MARRKQTENEETDSTRLDSTLLSVTFCEHSTTMNAMHNAFTSMVAAIRQRPTLFNGLTGGSLFAGSDAIAQEMEQTGLASTHENVDSFNSHRFISTVAIGAVIGGFVYPSAYKRLDRLWPGTDWSTVLKKSLVEIFTVGIFVNSISIISRGLMVGRESSHVAMHALDELPDVTKNDFAFGFRTTLLPFQLSQSTFDPLPQPSWKHPGRRILAIARTITFPLRRWSNMQ